MTARTATILLAVLSGAASAQGEGPFLHSLSVTVKAPKPLLRSALTLTAELARPPAASSELLLRSVARQGERTFRLRADEYPRSPDEATRAHRADSFVIDYEEPSMKALRAEAQAKLGKRPTPEQLRDFVRATVRGGLARGFDIASQVATRREGDCTEYAVLLTALLRAFGHPARVALGAAVLFVEERVEGAGHAWAEVYREGEWRVLDAALPSGMPVTYLPAGVMREEGPGFTLGVMGAVAQLHLRALVLEPVIRARAE